MEKIEAWYILKGNKTEAKSLANILEGMGFDKRSFMVINRYDNDFKIGDTMD